MDNIESQEAQGKYLFGAAKVGERGQIVIPKKAREVFGIKPGDMMLMLGDIHQGIALVKLDVIQDIANNIFRNNDAQQTEPTSQNTDAPEEEASPQ